MILNHDHHHHTAGGGGEVGWITYELAMFAAAAAASCRPYGC